MLLRDYMLVYMYINLLSMVDRFSDTEVRVATDSFYIDIKNSKAVAEFTNFDEQLF